MNYSSFGILRSVKNSAGEEIGFENAPVRSSFSFTGREYEPELGIYYYRARYYDPSTGRFLQQDPDAGKLADPRTFLSKYIYAGNNPVMISDPTGKWWFVVALLAAGIFQGISNVNSAKEAGYTGGKLLETFINGFVMGAIQAAVTIKYGFWAGLGAAFATGMANNIFNQRIFVDKHNSGIDWRSAATGGLLRLVDL